MAGWGSGRRGSRGWGVRRRALLRRRPLRRLRLGWPRGRTFQRCALRGRRVRRARARLDASTLGARILGMGRSWMGVVRWPVVGLAVLSELDLDRPAMGLGRAGMGLARRVLGAGSVRIGAARHAFPGEPL